MQAACDRSGGRGRGAAADILHRSRHPRVEAAFLVEMLDIALRIADEIEERLS
jgi:hypothetical protein